MITGEIKTRIDYIWDTTLMLFKKGDVVWRGSGAMSANELKILIGQHS